MNIKLPKSSKDLRIKHLKPIQSDKYLVKMDMNLMIDFIHDFTGVKKSQLMRIDVKDIIKMSNHINNLYANFDVNSKPPKEITVNGKEYEMINPEKVGVGWHIDWNDLKFKLNTDFSVDVVNGDNPVTNDPVRMACLMYFPKGAIYGDTDENDNLINPIKDRYKEFENHFPLQTFLEASDFFLERFVQSAKRYTGSQILINQARKLNPFNGKM